MTFDVVGVQGQISQHPPPLEGIPKRHRTEQARLFSAHVTYACLSILQRAQVRKLALLKSFGLFVIYLRVSQPKPTAIFVLPLCCSMAIQSPPHPTSLLADTLPITSRQSALTSQGPLVAPATDTSGGRSFRRKSWRRESPDGTCRKVEGGNAIKTTKKGRGKRPGYISTGNADGDGGTDGGSPQRGAGTSRGGVDVGGGWIRFTDSEGFQYCWNEDLQESRCDVKSTYNTCLWVVGNLKTTGGSMFVGSCELGNNGWEGYVVCDAPITSQRCSCGRPDITALNIPTKVTPAHH